MGAVIAFHQNIANTLNAAGCHRCRRNFNGGGKPHAQLLVRNHTLKSLNLRFQNMRAGGTIERQRNHAIFQPDRDLVLGSRKGQTDARLTRHQRTLGQGSQDAGQLSFV